MQTRIREAEEDDVNAVLQLLKLMQEDERRYDPLLKNADESEGSLRSYVESCIKGMKKGARLLLVAENGDGKIVGVVSGRIITYGGIYRQEKVLYIDNLYVLDKARGKGIGSVLLSEAEKKAREIGVRIVELDAYTTSHDSIKFYEKRGYISIYTRMRKILKENGEK